VSDNTTVAAIADLQARVKVLEELPARVTGVEKAMWGWGGALAALGFMFGLLSDWIKGKFGA
jgi:hypothetical protein